MRPLVFEDYREMSMWIKAHGALPSDSEVKVGKQVILVGRPDQERVCVRS